MSYTLRRALAASALSVAALGYSAVGAAADDTETPSAECVSATAQVATAHADFVAARTAFVATNEPLGKLLAAERQAARTEVRSSEVALQQLQKQAASTRDKAMRRALKKQIRTERADIRHSSRLLNSKAALCAQVRAQRLAAKAVFAAARDALAVAEAAADAACKDMTTPEPTD